MIKENGRNRVVATDWHLLTSRFPARGLRPERACSRGCAFRSACGVASPAARGGRRIFGRCRHRVRSSARQEAGLSRLPLQQLCARASRNQPRSVGRSGPRVGGMCSLPGISMSASGGPCAPPTVKWTAADTRTLEGTRATVDDAGIRRVDKLPPSARH